MKAILFDMQSGIAGDMVCAAALENGIEFRTFADIVKTLPLEFDVKFEKVVRSGIAAGYFKVIYPHQHYHRHLGDILELIERSSITAKAKNWSIAIFNRLAEAEALVHGTTIEKVHFHEVGAVDSIVDIVGASQLFDMLGVEKFFATPFVHGYGSVKTEHGLMGVPAPATVELTKGYKSIRIDVEGELTTPTGASIVTSLVLPDSNPGTHKIVSTGCGAGTKEFQGMPNVLRLSVIETESLSPVYSVSVLETNIDDASPEIIGRAMERLLNDGALDVYTTPVYMKKNRQAVKLSAIVSKEDVEKLAKLIMVETGTIGVRFAEYSRICLDRQLSTVETKWGNVGVKVISTPSGKRITPEYESCKELSEKTGIPVRLIYEEIVRISKSV